MTDLVAEVERRGEEANKTPQGADYRQIVRDVAKEHDVDPQDLRNDCLDRWTQTGAG